MKSSFLLLRQTRRSYGALGAFNAAAVSRSPLAWDRRGASTSGSGSLSVAQFTKIAPMVLLREALQQHTALDDTLFAATHHKGQNHIIIRRDTFDGFCRLSHVEDAARALEAMDEAGLVVSLAGGQLVHLRPVLYVETLEAALSPQAAGAHALEPAHFLLEVSEKKIEDLRKEEAAMRAALQPAIAKAARWRRSVWGGALCFAGAQLAIISRLTYFDLDWDIMEPVSYFVGIGTAILFYFYFLRFDDEHTYMGFDEQYLPKKVRQYAPRDFDWTRYEAICEQLVDETAVKERIKEWARSS
ncbi:hypothetical protein STCU_02826 [Strigomonas culicis]|uniref:Calcium uniporter protein C-terminal domain-containing protein n=1 Tax=Strigomonas culicis TaxID=28005 RepID=S9UU45_9TRYP|nr:hypothetical protein STCU_02826 [Strigomonas culicis]|eukprot:EPY32408.1 hypothetical protein STCU_02826 [Strigomonas culicis]